jgi:type III secretion protein U
MADKNDSGDKTEKPTSQKLEDARKKGDVPKSREVSSTAGLALWLALGALATTYAATRIAALFDSLFATIGGGWQVSGFALAARSLGAQAGELALMLVAMLVVPVAALGLLTDFLQAGPVLTFEKIKPKLDAMNPAEGVKRMFSLDNLVEVLKALVKAALLVLLGWLVVRSELPQIVALGRSPSLAPAAIGAQIWSVVFKLLAWAVALFALVSVLDAAYQRYSFTKKMRMSRRDIKQERKDSEGDPHVRHRRRQMQKEWSQRQAEQSARNASALVVNPTHIAIAIDYDHERCPVPTIAAKGEGELARAMREAAEDAGVPIVRNIPLARDLLKRSEVGEIIPKDLFDIIAEVILWAREVQEQVDAQRRHDLSACQLRRRVAAPGEDLTHYPNN